MTCETVSVRKEGAVTIITIERPDVRNCVDQPTAQGLSDAFLDFERDESASVAILTGAGGYFCAGADLKAVSEAKGRANRVLEPGTGDGFDALTPEGPMGPSRMLLSKPVIAAIEGYAVAGGLELACWCDMRVVAEDATMGVFCRRWGVPLIDGGTVRLPRLIGHSHAMDLILTGRPVDAVEAMKMGLANRTAPKGKALEEALKLAEQIAQFPQKCMRHDRLSSYAQWDKPYDEAMHREYELGIEVIRSKETVVGATRFASGKGRGGSFKDI